jgi:hypothetical protein
MTCTPGWSNLAQRRWVLKLTAAISTLGLGVLAENSIRHAD